MCKADNKNARIMVSSKRGVLLLLLLLLLALMTSFMTTKDALMTDRSHSDGECENGSGNLNLNRQQCQ